MSAIRHCAEAMFLEIFCKCNEHFVLFCQQITECAAVEFESEEKELLSISWVGLFFSYTQSSSTEHYLGLEGS